MFDRAPACRKGWQAAFALVAGLGFAAVPGPGAAAPVTVWTDTTIGVGAWTMPGTLPVVAGGTGVMKGEARAGTLSSEFEYSLKKNANLTFDATGVKPLPTFPGIAGVPALRLHPPAVASSAASAAASASYALEKTTVTKNNQQVEAIQAQVAAGVDIRYDPFHNPDRPFAKASSGDPLELSTADPLGISLTLHKGAQIGGIGDAMTHFSARTGSSASEELLDIVLALVDAGGTPDLRVSARVLGVVDTALAAAIDQAFTYDLVLGGFRLDDDLLLYETVLGAAASGRHTLAFDLTAQAQSTVPVPGGLSLTVLAMAAAAAAGCRRRRRC